MTGGPVAECAVCRQKLPKRPVERTFCSDDCLCDYLLVADMLIRFAPIGRDQGPAQVTQSAVCDAEDRRG